MPKPTKQKAPKGRGNGPKPSGSTISDPRFSKMLTDPRFRLPSKKNNRVTLDKRFAHMLKDDDFSKKASVDRYGRKVSKDAGKKELERIYRVEDEDQDEEEENSEKEDEDAADQSSEEADDDDEVQRELARIDRKYDPARDGGFSSSSDEDSDDDDDDDEDAADVAEDVAVEFPNNGNDPQVEELDDPTTRIAVVNLDWDNIRATDLMAVASSFVPAEGRILKVTVYPSEFGRERMEREELEGPPREIFSKNKKRDESEPEEDSDSEDERIKQDLLQEDKGEEFDSKALRQYQLERLRYYYALIECDSTATAKYLYDNMDGREYLSSANFFDMRFVPDDVSFEEDRPRDECSQIPDGYRPNEFVTDALTHSKVKLTWDADDTTRKEVQKRAFSQKEIDENDLKAYIGTDSSDDEESDEALSSGDEAASTTTHDRKTAREEKAAKLRAALGLASGSLVSKKKKGSDAPVGDMQITFTSGLSNKSKDEGKKGVFENAPEESTREKYIRKEKERKQRRKERAKAARTGTISNEQAAQQDAASDDEASAAEDDDDDNNNNNNNNAPDPDGDDPFNDPFFTDPAGETQRAAKAAKKASKQKAAAERAAAAEAAAAERAQLELLMADEGADAKLKHFDMKAIEKADKDARRKGKKKGGKKKDKRAGDDDDNADAQQTGFSMDTADPRFKAVFESHEYAIDPTNPRFKRTQAMTALLEEGRRKRKDRAERDDVDVPVERGAPAGKKAKRSAGADEGAPAAGGDDLKRLVEKVKSKTAARKGKA